ncbi:MAG: aldo/keto reductase [Chloroflexi bacterium]|nr:aldo/keto reductase [Chloroflexota bacterium]
MPELPRIPSVTLGRTGLVTSKLSLGTYGWGGLGPPEVRVEGDDTILELLRAAFRAGIRFINTAEAYANESILGRLLPEADPPADLLIATTFGHGKGFTADQFRASAERSLRELRLEKLPLMFVHDPRTADDMRFIMGPGGALEGLRKLQSEGLLEFIGVATGTLAPLQIAVESDEFDVIQFPRLYTLLNQSARSSGLLAAARARKIGTLSASPFGGAILGTGTRVGEPLYTFAPALPEVVAAVERMERRCAELGVSIATAALAYNYTESLVDVTVPGMVSVREIVEDVSAFGCSLSREELESIAAAGRIDPLLLGGPEFASSWPPDRRPTREQLQARWTAPAPRVAAG